MKLQLDEDLENGRQTSNRLTMSKGSDSYTNHQMLSQAILLLCTMQWRHVDYSVDCGSKSQGQGKKEDTTSLALYHGLIQECANALYHH